MFIKLLMVCFYLTFVYWVSFQTSAFHMLFYPTLGAFSYFFISRSISNRELLKIICAAVIGVTCSSILHLLYPGIVTFFITCVVTVSMIHFLKLKAAPIVAVSLVPYFSKLSSVWIFPVSVLCSLGGLLLVLYFAQLIETTWNITKERVYPSTRKKSFDKNFIA